MHTRSSFLHILVLIIREFCSRKIASSYRWELNSACLILYVIRNGFCIFTQRIIVAIKLVFSLKMQLFIISDSFQRIEFQENI
jgi:hypothetical protein